MLKQLWRQMKSAFAPPPTPKKPDIDLTQLPILERCRVIYTAMDLTPFQYFTLNHGRQKNITVAHPTIEHCIQDLGAHLQFLQTFHYINQNRVNYENFSRPINRFLLTQDGCYLSSVYGTVSALRTAVLELIAAVDDTRELDYYSYNLRMLNALMYTLYDLGTGLMEIEAHIKANS